LIVISVVGCGTVDLMDALAARDNWAKLHHLSIDSITPESGEVGGGTEVTIRGTGFDNGVGVLFGPHAAASIEFVNEGLMRVTTPAQDAGEVPLTLVSPYGDVVQTGASFTYVEPTSGKEEPPPSMAPTLASVTPRNGPTSGGTIVTIKGTGFVPGMAVLFDDLAANTVNFVNSGLLTAVTPAHAAAIVDVTVTTPDLLNATLSGAFEYALDFDGDGVADVDSDGDGLSDLQEAAGWDVRVDLFGVGSDGDAVTYRATSDAHDADTDGDGLSDYFEFQLHTDARTADTDNDGLCDFDEVQRWRTSPVSVDTDGDSRGPSGSAAPNAALFDGRELYTAAELAEAPATRTLKPDATSPTLADTDGDGRTDYEELEDPTRSPLIADLPLVAIDFDDAVDVRLNVEYAEEKGETHEYSESLSKTDTSDSKFSYELMAGVEFGTKIASEAEGSAGLFEWGKAKQTLEFSLTLKSESTWNWEWGQSHSEESAYSSATSDSRAMTETAADGSMTAGVRISNPGKLAYHLDNLAITVRYWERTIDAETGEIGGNFRTMATLTPALADGVTLAPGESTPVLQVAADGINADRIKQFLAHPSSLVLEAPYFDVESEDGVNFAFVQEVTQTRTANLLIDFGGGVMERYCLATNVDRTPEGEYAGLNLHRVMTEFLAIPVETTQQDHHGNAIPSTLVKVRSLPADDAGPFNGWLVLGSNDDFADPSVAFEDISLRAGDTVMLVLITDADGDGLNQQEEALYGAGEGVDYDGDGISDLDEAKTHYDDAGRQVQAGWMVRVHGSPAYRVLSDPREADADGDGLSDLQERGGCAVNGLLTREYSNETECLAHAGVWYPYAGMGCICGEEAATDCTELDNQADCETHGGAWTPFGTDPTIADTDGDTVPDNVDAAPLTPAPKLHVAPGPVDGNGLSWAQAHNSLSTALADAAARNANPDPADDIAEIWVAAGMYTLDSEQALLSNVAIYGGFAGNEDKRSQRDANPFTNGTAIVGQPGQNHRAFSATHATNVVLDGFTMSDWSVDTALGGPALLIDTSTGIRVANMQFINNRAVDWGGALGTTADAGFESELVVSNCVFAANETYGGEGGALACGDTALTLINTDFIDNHASVNGGALTLAFSKLVGVGCRFEGNQAGSFSISSAAGGAINSLYSRTKLTNCRFADNSAIGTQAWGGGIAATLGDLTLTNCVFWRNYALFGAGGALCLTNVNASIFNCTIVGNASVDVSPTPAVLMIPGFLRIQNSIVAFNGGDPTDEADCGPNIDFNGTVHTEDFFISHTCVYPARSDLGGAWLVHSYMTNRCVDPAFADGWHTSGLLRLSSDSPLIDTGSNFLDVEPTTPGVQFLPAIDYAGNWRIVDGNGDGEATVDFGAYEFQGGSGSD